LSSEIKGAVALESVTFAYDKEAAPALIDVSFSVAAGERVGIVGSIGSGKTTILKLVHALHRPLQGHVLVDGMPVAQIDPACLRAGLGLALQNAELFHGTIRSNIALADPAASDEAVIEAARLAGALDWIARCPKGLETPVRERGAGLSGGQCQSVTLARALFRRPRIILLDEPTSNMDSRSELLAVQGVREAARGRTLIVVSHRPALLGLVDRLIVLEGGRKIFDGPKDKVVKDLEALSAERARSRSKPAGAT
jgi:ATP-binding cassette subfamily C protein LapB